MSTTDPKVTIARLPRIPELDGLRGLAILAVLIFHSTIFAPSSQFDAVLHSVGTSLWIGVDLFFVLSGFLITGILFDSKGQRFYLRNFYIRRALRIFPLYFLVLSITIFVLPRLSSRFPEIGDEQWWYWCYLSNFDLVSRGLKHLVLGPTWSLAIEEQFYLLWPLVICCLSRRQLMALCLMLSAVAVGSRWWLFEQEAQPNVIYLSTHTRMDTLAVGSFLALAARGPKGLAALAPWAWVTLVLFGGYLVSILFDGHLSKSFREMILYGYSAVAFCCGALLVLTLTRQANGLTHRLLTSSPLLFFGKYSYALYLFNRPFVDIIREGWFEPSFMPAIVGSSFPGQALFSLVFIAIPSVMAVVSWHVFEKHFLLLKRHFDGTSEKN